MAADYRQQVFYSLRNVTTHDNNRECIIAVGDEKNISDTGPRKCVNQISYARLEL